MRILETSLELGGKAFLIGRAVAQRTRKPPGHGVEYDHGRELAAGEDVRADRDRVVREVHEDPLVEALETG
jgi:hypothetical protein